MDQDFHFYGTFHSALSGGFDKHDATLIAKAANFIDFFSESTYASYWDLVSDKEKSSTYTVVAKMENPRYTFQGGLLGTLASPEDGLWCSYHFIPGNYGDPAGTPSAQQVHGANVAGMLPGHLKRDTFGSEDILEKFSPLRVKDLQHGRMLNRPQSALSRRLIEDAVRCAGDESRLESIIGYAIAGDAVLANDRADVLRRFRLILLGIRAHVIADTWAHQDHCGLDNVMNTYWDADYDPDSSKLSEGGNRVQSLYYQDGASQSWTHRVLSSLSINRNFEAVPSATSFLGHGWLGHLPDYSFVKFRYKPCWADPRQAVERDNPEQYGFAWIELTSLFRQVTSGRVLTPDEQFEGDLAKARQAIESPCELSAGTSPGKSSAQAWCAILNEMPDTPIDVDREPDGAAVLDGMLERSHHLDRYGTSHVAVQSDLYLFQIAADYHFHFVRHYLETHDLYHFASPWSRQRSTLSDDVKTLFQ